MVMENNYLSQKYYSRHHNDKGSGKSESLCFGRSSEHRRVSADQKTDGASGLCPGRRFHRMGFQKRNHPPANGRRPGKDLPHQLQRHNQRQRLPPEPKTESG